MALSFKTNQSLERMQSILLLIKESPKTCLQLRTALNMNPDVCRSYLRHLLDEKQIYIHSFVVESHCWSRVYAIGNKKNADIDAYKAMLTVDQIKRRKERDKIRFARMTELGLRRVKERKPRKPRQKKPFEIKPDLAAAWLFNPL